MDKRCLIVGCGMTGAVIARELADHGYQVKILEKRDHIGGNMYDCVEKHGFLVSRYGPHAFHTNDESLYEYIRRFEAWQPYQLRCSAFWDGKCVPTPFNYSAIDAFYPAIEAERIKKEFDRIFTGNREITVVDALNHPNKDVRAFAEYLFENDYSLYTSKQWNMKPEEIDPSVLKRVPIRMSYEVGYFTDRYQVMPKHSYTQFFENLLNHGHITVKLNTNALEQVSLEGSRIKYRGEGVDYPVVYTGALDELFGCAYGKLPYRSLRFEWRYEDTDSFQEEAIVAYPKEEGFTRITEYKKLPVQDKKGSVIAVEYPAEYRKDGKTEAYYPVLTEESRKLFEQYDKKAEAVKNLYCCGRLGNFKYYNMDQALKAALEMSEKIIEENR